MIHIIRASIHNRLVRLHRPHLLKGYEEPDSDLSRVVAVNSARSIVNGLILFNTNTRIRPKWVQTAMLQLTRQLCKTLDPRRMCRPRN